MSNASPLVGDPASVSALAATLRSSAARLSSEAGAVRSSLADAEAGPGWTGPTALGQRQRARAVADALDGTARALDECSEVLQRAAAELAARVAELRSIHEEAERLGLRVRDGMVTRGWGITGVADATEVSATDDARARLDARLHATASALGRQRSRLAHDCTDARRTLEAIGDLL